MVMHLVAPSSSTTALGHSTSTLVASTTRKSNAHKLNSTDFRNNQTDNETEYRSQQTGETRHLVESLQGICF